MQNVFISICINWFNLKWHLTHEKCVQAKRHCSAFRDLIPHCVWSDSNELSNYRRQKAIMMRTLPRSQEYANIQCVFRFHFRFDCHRLTLVLCIDQKWGEFCGPCYCPALACKRNSQWDGIIFVGYFFSEEARSCDALTKTIYLKQCGKCVCDFAHCLRLLIWFNQTISRKKNHLECKHIFQLNYCSISFEMRKQCGCDNEERKIDGHRKSTIAQIPFNTDNIIIVIQYFCCSFNERVFMCVYSRHSPWIISLN